MLFKILHQYVFYKGKCLKKTTSSLLRLLPAGTSVVKDGKEDFSAICAAAWSVNNGMRKNQSCCTENT